MVDVRTRYEIGNERLLDGLIGVLLVAGLVLLALNGPFSSVRDLRLANFVVNVLPIALAIACYLRVASTVSVLEIGALVIWAYYTIRVSGVIAFFLFGVRSASYPGELAELRRNVALFLATTAVLGGLYSAGAAQEDRPLLKWGLVAVVPLGQLAAYAVVLYVVA
ncbi:hypothetical protein [Halosolutus gelatinilyticus]|uniref:hypothetical protein n=1 Tax=Halosolutus gelatinilyticus TaxID=2931975 RepID=UPI001FF5B3D1|nr:hypothetical protein [Halosolutus gelatinilyticus]